MQLDIDEPHLEVLDRFISKRAARERFMDAFDDQFHRLVKVLDTFGHVDKHVGALDILDVLCLVLFHARFHQHITAFEHRLVHRDLTALDQVDNCIGQNLKVKIEPVMPVRGLAFDRFNL